MLTASLLRASLLLKLAASKEVLCQGRDVSDEPPYKPVWEVYASSSPARRRSKVTTFGAANRELRSDCTFPMCITILQDATGSFYDDYMVTADKVLPAMAEVMNRNHPNSTYTLVRFGDKPFQALGEDTDVCQSLEVLRAESPMDLEYFYKSFLPGGGWDMPENQYGALVATLNSPVSIPYCTNPDAVRLVVMITDSGPHFEGDSAQVKYPDMKSWGNGYDETLADEYCSKRYYPAPLTAKESLLKANAYFTAIVSEREGDTSTPYESWKWFINFVGLPDDFAKLQDEADEGWWTGLDKVISSVEVQECGSTVASMTSTLAPSDATMMPAGSLSELVRPTDATMQVAGSATPLQRHTTAATDATQHPSVTAIAQPSASVVDQPSLTAVAQPSATAVTLSSVTAVDLPSDWTGSTLTTEAEDTDNCVCPPENVTCCAKQPEILIALMHRPKELDIHLANDL